MDDLLFYEVSTNALLLDSVQEFCFPLVPAMGVLLLFDTRIQNSMKNEST